MEDVKISVQSSESLGSYGRRGIERRGNEGNMSLVVPRACLAWPPSSGIVVHRYRERNKKLQVKCPKTARS